MGRVLDLLGVENDLYRGGKEMLITVCSSEAVERCCR